METSVSYSELIKGKNYYISMEDKCKKHSLNSPKRETGTKDQILSKIFKVFGKQVSEEKHDIIKL